ncbi:Pycsar system effector family protein [Streptomyces sp. NPDC002467]|uniref:Pycsar system effector family protein n=1 Tax=Streptomyces sp. NPDC002467 TaxID=3364647 RepID=UPI0036A36682
MTASDEAATRLLTDLRVEIARADTKAALLLGALGMTTGVVSGPVSGPARTPGALSGPAAILWWAGAAALALALLALLLAVLPRSLRSAWQAGSPLAYFGDVHSADRQGHLDEALTDTGHAPGSAVRAALAANSLIAVRKHQWIRVGLLAYGCGTVLMPAALLLG